MNSVKMDGITKYFPGVIANKNVHLELEAGKITAIVGENGAGKSTLMNILYGLFTPDDGSIMIDSQNVIINEPIDAISLGIGMVHQHFMLIPSLSVLENIVFGNFPTKQGFVDLNQAKIEVLELLKRFDVDIDIYQKVKDISVGNKQYTEILKALYRKIDVLILDEPTAVLTPAEIAQLFKTLRGLANENKAIVLITHKLKEVMDISDNIVIMRKGQVVGELLTCNASIFELACLMVGSEELADKFVVDASRKYKKDTVLELDNVSSTGFPGLSNVSLVVNKSEILGIAGVEGNGQKELVEVLLGLRQCKSGSIILNGINLTNKNINFRRQCGIACVPEDRMEWGVSLFESVSDNLIMGLHREKPIAWRKMILSYKNINEYVNKLISKFNILTSSNNVPVKNLSGGNIQKVILAREISKNPNLIVAAQPTRGLDFSSINYVHSLLLEIRDKGSSVVVVSSEIEGLIQLCDRIVVFYGGEIIGTLNREEITYDNLGVLISGSSLH